MNFHLIFFFI
jgi:MFS family permease